jgi:hypothetical protein
LFLSWNIMSASFPENSLGGTIRRMADGDESKADRDAGTSSDH